MIGLGSVDCDSDEEWCNKMSPSGANVVFWKRIGGIESIDGEYHEIMLHDAQEITNSIFDLLPNPTDLDEEAIQVILEITALRSTFAYQLLATLKIFDFPCFTF